MAQNAAEMDLETITCSICLDLLKDPTTIPCGHSYCMICIKNQWDREEEKRIYSCPQCRETFMPRPALGKSVILAVLVEQLKKTGLIASPAEHHYAGPEDVACDSCSGRKLKALKSCLVCLASYCEKHLQPHHDSAAFKNHKLVEPSKNLLENICSLHNEVMKMFCRTDQRCICYLCSVDEHKGHNTVSAAAERAEKQRALEVSRQNIRLSVQARQKDAKMLQQEEKDINSLAATTVEYSEGVFTELMSLITDARSKVKQQVKSQQEAAVSRVRELQMTVERQTAELERRDDELKKLSLTEDHNQFLHIYPSLPPLSQPTVLTNSDVRPRMYFGYVTGIVSAVRDKVKDVLSEACGNISLTSADVDVLLSGQEPVNRTGFLTHICEIALDPNTAHTRLLLSEGNRKAARLKQRQSYPSHPHRFTGCCQVLSSQSLPGQCYWEVEWTGGAVDVALAYKNISRSGELSEFGSNNKSWLLRCDANSYEFWHNGTLTALSGPRASRVGVFLNHGEGLLSFYSISGTMTLLHKVQTTFTQPLYAGLWLESGATAEFFKLK